MTKQKQEGRTQKEIIRQALSKVMSHPLFSDFHYNVSLNFENADGLPFTFNQYGVFYVYPQHRWGLDEWAYAFANALTQLGMGLINENTPAFSYFQQTSAYLQSARFLKGLRVPTPERFVFQDDMPVKGFHELAQWLSENKKTKDLQAFMPYETEGFFIPKAKAFLHQKRPDFEKYFSHGLRRSVEAALDVAAGRRKTLQSHRTESQSVGQQARMWLLTNYPLLSNIASYFKIEESIDACRIRNVRVAMINFNERVVYLNPLAGLNDKEWLWVLAHEYLHAGLNHSVRCDGRDPEIWNAACDFAINLWLEELRIGQRPSIGVLYDIQFKGWSSERIYDFLVKNIRILRKWESLAGPGARDFIGDAQFGDTAAEEYCRSALVQGCFKHRSTHRGFLPAELEEAIRALEQPIIPWDVQLGRWFDLHVPFPEKRRTYLRPSRRQQSCPDTPLPRSIVSEEFKSNAHTFGVVLDTSGSMERNLLAKALGVIAQYAISKEVPAVRLIFCDTQPYDAGYIRPEDLLYEPIRVVGRGGTILAPAIDYFDTLTDFPEDAPLLILTDGATDIFNVSRTHAFVLPKGKRLPFNVHDVFYVD
jgi:predicted metal-dependent peptidase